MTIETGRTSAKTVGPGPTLRCRSTYMPERRLRSGSSHRPSAGGLTVRVIKPTFSPVIGAAVSGSNARDS